MKVSVNNGFQFPNEPGMITAIVALFPVSLYGIVYAGRNNLMRPLDWFISFLIMAAGLIIAQQIVVRNSGMKYSEFMKNVKASFANKKA